MVQKIKRVKRGGELPVGRGIMGRRARTPDGREGVITGVWGSVFKLYGLCRVDEKGQCRRCLGVFKSSDVKFLRRSWTVTR